MHGRAVALGAGTVLNALATGVGSAFAIDAETTATVELDPDAEGVTGRVAGAPGADTRLVERCVERVVAAHGDGEGGVVETESDLPMAAGLKSSSAAANATALATLEALDVPVVTDPAAERAAWTSDATAGEPLDGAGAGAGDDGVTRVAACRTGVAAARDVGVTVTGAFDDASASMLGGVVVTNNRADDLLAREPVDWDVLVWTPAERAYTADADVDRCERVAPLAELVADLALDGRYADAMSVNGLAFSAALGFDPEPAVEALPHAAGVSLSGTGPSVVAVGDADRLTAVRDAWDARPGRTWTTTTRTDGAHTT
jgi:shikimate kinase